MFLLSPQNPKKSRVLTWLMLSIGLHLGAAMLLIAFTTLPQLDFKLELPVDVEIGITEGKTFPLADPPPAAPVPEEPPAQTEPATRIPATTAPQPNKDSKNKVKNRAKDKPSSNKPAVKISHRRAQNNLSKTFKQQGSLISIRADMVKIRRSQFSTQVAQLLSAIPDWKQLLDGSGIDPLKDLDALLIASPNFSRSSLIIAGRHRGGIDKVRTATQQMAQARGQEITWTDMGSIPIAAWYAIDPTPRIIAALGQDYFVICRQRDLTAFLTIALADTETDYDDGDHIDAGIHVHENLFSIRGQQVLDIQVEGARNFARGRTKGIPTQLLANITETSDDQIAFNIEGRFASNSEAQDGQAYWQRQRDRFAQSPFVAILGLSSLLSATKISTRARTLKVKSVMQSAQTRLLLNTLQSMLASPDKTPGQ